MFEGDPTWKAWPNLRGDIQKGYGVNKETIGTTGGTVVSNNEDAFIRVNCDHTPESCGSWGSKRSRLCEVQNYFELPDGQSIPATIQAFCGKDYRTIILYDPPQ